MRRFQIEVTRPTGGGPSIGRVWITLDEVACKILGTDRRGTDLELHVGLGAAFIVSDNAEATNVKETTRG
jgi:hypothetical protein